LPGVGACAISAVGSSASVHGSSARASTAATSASTSATVGMALALVGALTVIARVAPPCHASARWLTSSSVTCGA
jgi:hypothetical protein